MIARIQGVVDSIEDSTIVVFVSGIGYKVSVSLRVIDALAIGDEITLHTYQYVREDLLELFGFQEKEDLHLFEQLILVSGVGPRLALTLLSHLPSNEIKRAIIHGDVPFLTSVSGVGKKTAERIVLELKESIDVSTISTTQQTSGDVVMANAMDVLLALGYSQLEAIQALQGIDLQLPIEDQVRQALKNKQV